MQKKENPESLEDISIVDLLNNEWHCKDWRKNADKKIKPSMKKLQSRRKNDRKKYICLFTFSIAVITTILLQIIH